MFGLQILNAIETIHIVTSGYLPSKCFTMSMLQPKRDPCEREKSKFTVLKIFYFDYSSCQFDQARCDGSGGSSIFR